MRVPLILHGPGLAPGRTARGASGVDFARTIADLARVPPAAHWEGDALLRLQEDRPIFACEGDFEMDGPPTVAIIDGRYKIIVLRDDDGLDWEDVCAAYDLEEDAGERTDLLGADLPWPQRILRRLGPISEGHLQACVDAPSLYLDAEQIATLEAMGYAARQR